MTFADIPSGAAVMIDANSIIHHFISELTYGAAATKLLERLEFNDIVSYPSIPLCHSERKSMVMATATCRQAPNQIERVFKLIKPRITPAPMAAKVSAIGLPKWIMQ